MTTGRYVFIMAALCGLGTLGGCMSRCVPQDSTKFTVGNTDRFTALDSDADAAVSCTGLQERMLGDGRLEVIANVKNRGGRAARVQIRCLFLVGRETPEEAGDPWQALDLAGDATQAVRFTAPDASSRRYAIQVRAAR